METEIRRAMDTIWLIRSYGDNPSPEVWRQILEMLAPFREHSYLSGAVSRDASNRVLSLVWACTGDAYRETGDFVAAATAYRTAGVFRPGSYYADYYAKMVLEKKFSDHYEAALNALEEGERLYHQSRPSIRLFAHLWTVLAHPVVYVKYLQDLALRSSRRRELRRRIGELRAS